MTVDKKVWRDVLLDAVRAIADEDFQRRAWFGAGPERSSPDETINQFFSNAAFDDFLSRNIDEMEHDQIIAGKNLLELMEKFSDETPNHLIPEKVIDDPRWKNIQGAAKKFLSKMELRELR